MNNKIERKSVGIEAIEGELIGNSGVLTRAGAEEVAVHNRLVALGRKIPGFQGVRVYPQRGQRFIRGGE